MQTPKRSVMQVLIKSVCLLAVIVVLTLATRNNLAAQSAAEEVGVAAAGQDAIELIGKIDQDGLAFKGYGYLTYISGVPDDQMFTDPINRSEATARFTFASSAQMTARSVIETIFVLNAAGSTTIYFNEKPGASFEDPNTFAAGTPIAVSSERWQNIISVQAPDTAIATGVSEFTETTVNPFTLNGEQYQLGHVNLTLRFSYTGQAKRTDKILPRSTIVIAGNAVVGSAG
jgi:hypothetical protein